MMLLCGQREGDEKEVEAEKEERERGGGAEERMFLGNAWQREYSARREARVRTRGKLFSRESRAKIAPIDRSISAYPSNIPLLWGGGEGFCAPVANQRTRELVAARIPTYLYLGDREISKREITRSNSREHARINEGTFAHRGSLDSR